MKTLIVYASRRGSTRSCAELIVKSQGCDARLVDLGSEPVPGLEGYDAIVLGANAFSKRLNKEASRFARQNLGALLARPLFLFICSGSDEAGARRLYQASYPAILLSHARRMENFGGRLETSGEPWLMRRILAAMGKRDYDTLDPGRVAEWARQNLVAANLAEARGQGASR